MGISHPPDEQPFYLPTLDEILWNLPAFGSRTGFAVLRKIKEYPAACQSVRPLGPFQHFLIKNLHLPHNWESFPTHALSGGVVFQQK